MKKLIITIFLLSIAATVIFAQESSEKIITDANALLRAMEAKSEEYHLFLGIDAFQNIENRAILNEYRTKFSSINARINNLKNRISIAQRSRDPNIESIRQQRQELQSQVDEYDGLLSDFRQWVSRLM